MRNLKYIALLVAIMVSISVSAQDLKKKSGAYEVDAESSSLTFKINNYWTTKVKGTFSNISGSIIIKDILAESKVDLEIVSSSLNTGMGTRDKHLKSADFFDAIIFPEIKYQGTSIEESGFVEYPYILKGNLTIKKVTLPVDVAFKFAEKKDVLIFAGEAKVSKDEFRLDDWKGVGVGDFAEVSFILVAKK